MPFKKPHQTSNPAFITPKTDPLDRTNIIGYDIEAKGLNIIWGSDLRYWRLTPEEYAELIQVSWLEVSGKVTVKPGKKYSVKFKVKVNGNGFGWDNTPVLVMAKVGKRGKYEYREVRLAVNKEQIIPEDNDSLTIPVGERETDLELHFGLYEVWSGKWKGGLIIMKAEVDEISS